MNRFPARNAKGQRERGKTIKSARQLALNFGLSLRLWLGCLGAVLGPTLVPDYARIHAHVGGRLHCSTLSSICQVGVHRPRDCIGRKKGKERGVEEGGEEGMAGKKRDRIEGRWRWRFIEFSNFKLPTECQQTFLSDYFTSDRYFTAGISQDAARFPSMKRRRSSDS